MIKYLIYLFIFPISFCSAEYYSQCGQDQFINENLFKNMKNGIFIDIGAHDGISLSNTYFFEKELSWSGICIEPIPEIFEKLQKNRGCLCICGCASVEEEVIKDFCRISGPSEMLSGLIDKYDPKHKQRIERDLKTSENTCKTIKVPCYNLNRILEKAGIQHVNFLSLDTEGGEFDILEDLDFNKFQIDVIAVENNYGNQPFIPFLESKGFVFFKSLEQDLIFLNKNFELKKRVDIVAYDRYLLPHDECPIRYDHLKESFDLTFTVNLNKYVKKFQGDESNLHKIVCFFNVTVDPEIKNLPMQKMICFKWEAEKVPLDVYDVYYRVYTFDDDLVDGRKYFKFYYPVLQPMLTQIPSFSEKNLCAMIATHWPSERVKILDFFESKPENSLHVYGRAPEPYYFHKMHKGSIPGYYSSEDKLETLKNYRFSICFENTHTTPGYITEKIFDAFAAGCVPIYWGPQNVGDYIPQDCFIDYQHFENDEEMYRFITSITENKYQLYIDHIRQFLQSEQARLFSKENFEQLLYEAVCYDDPIHETFKTNRQ
jgi:FkbM family methyltransferase